jgi:hypothetical protein
MTSTPKTIQIFLPSGDPHGIRIAEITTRIVQVFEVPRLLLADFLKTPESQQVALYFLIGQVDDGANPRVYIGQTGDLRARLTKHNKDKGFWERVLVLISRTNSLTQTHALYLEWFCLQSVRKAERYVDDNGNAGSKPHTPAPMEADCMEIFETGKTLLSTLGYPVFDPIRQQSSNSQIFYCKGPNADGRGLYTPEGFVVLKGSTGRLVEVQSLKDTPMSALRERLVESEIVKVTGGKLVFQKDHLFRSPSTAAMAVLGRNANGWQEWKDKEGKTLDTLKRQSLNA